MLKFAYIKMCNIFIIKKKIKNKDRKRSKTDHYNTFAFESFSDSFGWFLLISFIKAII